MRIAVDAMGGDYAPGEVVRGVLELASQPDFDDHIILVGDQARWNHAQRVWWLGQQQRIDSARVRSHRDGRASGASGAQETGFVACHLRSDGQRGRGGRHDFGWKHRRRDGGGRVGASAGSLVLNARDCVATSDSQGPVFAARCGRERRLYSSEPSAVCSDGLSLCRACHWYARAYRGPFECGHRGNEGQ